MTLSEFQRALKREFHDDIRIRWSYPRQAYLIETKAGRGIWDAPVATQPYRQQDEAIALRDGYKFFMEIRLGTRTSCLGCGLEGTIPAFKPVQFVCPRCRYIQAVAFFPLGDTLLDHLRKLNPKGTYRDRVIAELDRENRKREEALARETDNQIEAATLELYNDLVGIPGFHYSGSTDAWLDAPASPAAPEARA